MEKDFENLFQKSCNEKLSEYIKYNYTIIKSANYSLNMFLDNKGVSDNLITPSEKDILLSAKDILTVLESRFRKFAFNEILIK